MLMKYIGLLYQFISKVSSRIGVSLKDGKGMPLIPYPTPFSPSPLSLYPLSFLNYLLFLLSHPSFPVFPSLPSLLPVPFFITLSTLPSLGPFPLPFSRYSLLPSFSPPVLFLFLPISFSILFACAHLISSHSLLSPH